MHQSSRNPATVRTKKYVVPMAVEGTMPVLLVAVWTVGGLEMKYIRALSTAIDRYFARFEDAEVVVMRDFNCNAM